MRPVTALDASLMLDVTASSAGTGAAVRAPRDPRRGVASEAGEDDGIGDQRTYPLRGAHCK
jgi:hypothetical protein